VREGERGREKERERHLRRRRRKICSNVSWCNSSPVSAIAVSREYQDGQI
jgi:hypothetical protein